MIAPLPDQTHATARGWRESGRRGWRCGAAGALLVALFACGETGADPIVDSLRFDAAQVALDAQMTGTFLVTNQGERAIGPISLEASAIRATGGNTLPGRHLALTPEEIPTLAPGSTFEVEMEVVGTGTLIAGDFSATVTATLNGRSLATTSVDFSVAAGNPGLVEDLVVALDAAPIRQGDSRDVGALATGRDGATLAGFTPEWTTIPGDAGLVVEGRFVAYRPGTVGVIGRVGAAADTVTLEITPRAVAGEFRQVAVGRELARHTSDLWVHGDHAYLGTWGTRAPGAGANTGQGPLNGNTLYTWAIAGASPVRTSGLQVDARTVNDVKVNAAGTLGVITHEGSNDGLNGFTLLDLTDPAQPSPITRFTEGMSPGVHNVWIEGNYLYVVLDGGGGLRIVDISTPALPEVVWSFYAGTSFLHDVMVRDGLAFLSHWDAGLIVFDVGNGMAGGSPTAPVEVSRIVTLGGNTHNAWYWPEGGYVFVGQEDFGAPGYLHVVDFRDPTRPREVASFVVPGQTPHNFWMDEANETLFAAWYGNGIRALDVSGELLGELSAQGREMGALRYNGGAGVCGRETLTCTWAPQLHTDGKLYLSDQNNGLVVLEWVRN